MFDYCQFAARNLNAYLQILSNSAEIRIATLGSSSVMPYCSLSTSIFIPFLRIGHFKNIMFATERIVI